MPSAVPAPCASSSNRRVSSSQVNSSSFGGSQLITCPLIGGTATLVNRNTSRAPGVNAPSIVVGNHAARCSDSVSARQTFSGGCGSSRVNRTVTVPSPRSSVP